MSIKCPTYHIVVLLRREKCSHIRSHADCQNDVSATQMSEQSYVGMGANTLTLGRNDIDKECDPKDILRLTGDEGGGKWTNVSFFCAMQHGGLCERNVPETHCE